ncbi:MAG: alpha/beta hydrolase [Alphaproteobacteria bacterium]|nr:alpha/beta hydrolase [Alphaproteobacteria bacterium]
MVKPPLTAAIWYDRRTMLRFALTCVVAYLVFVGALTLFQRRLMYHPDPRPATPALAGVPEMEPLALEAADGVRLVAWYRPARDGNATVLYLHGNAGNIGMRGPKVRALLDAGLGVMLLSWRGYGGSAGAPTEAGLYDDGRAAFDALARRGVAANRLVLYGESLGSGIAVQLATERKIAALVLEAPFASATEVAAGAYPFVPVCWLLWDKFESIAKIAAVTAPILVMHGERDEVIPVDQGKRLFERATAPKQIALFPRGRHNDLDEQGALAMAIAFIRERAQP